MSVFRAGHGVEASLRSPWRSRCPGEATDGDMSIVEEFAEVMSDEWASIGLRGMYGYASRPR